MTTEEKVNGIIKEGIKHPLNFPLAFDVTNAGELEKYLKTHLNSIPLTNDLTCVIKDNASLYVKPIRLNLTVRNTYVMYRGIKIPTKGLYNQSKNKFTSRVCKRVLPTPIDVVPTEDPSDKYRFNINMVFNTID